MTQEDESRLPWLKSRANITLLVFLGIGGYFLLTEHWAHVIQALPYLLVLGCVVMHVFMHGNPAHGGHSDDQEHRFQSRGDKDGQ